jgi:hypothetical protein
VGSSLRGAVPRVIELYRRAGPAEPIHASGFVEDIIPVAICTAISGSSEEGTGIADSEAPSPAVAAEAAAAALQSPPVVTEAVAAEAAHSAAAAAAATEGTVA